MFKNKVVNGFFYSLTLLLLLHFGCSENFPPEPPADLEVPVRVFRQFKIPVFHTAREQLNYAKSGFSDFEERKAAYEIIPVLFPENIEACGNAALYSAYLMLGEDYRFAHKEQIRKAAAAYHQIILTYKDHPNILAKAHWYLGWLYTDLLGENAEGLNHFNTIVQAFPDIPMGITPPVPWVSLVYPEDTGQLSSKKQKVSTPWGSAALLEIVRHAEDKNSALEAFVHLWDSYRDTAPLAPALLILLADNNLREDAISYARDFLAAESTPNPYLAEDIRRTAGEE